MAENWNGLEFIRKNRKSRQYFLIPLMILESVIQNQIYNIVLVFLWIKFMLNIKYLKICEIYEIYKRIICVTSTGSDILHATRKLWMKQHWVWN